MSESAPVVVAEGAIVTESGMETPLEAVKPLEAAKQPEDKFAAKFAALTRKEKEIRQRETQYQQELTKIKAEREELTKWRGEKDTSESQLAKRAKDNPLKFLEEQGFTFEDLMKMQLNEQNPTPEMLIKRNREELESGYKKELQELRDSMAAKEEKEAQTKYEQTVSGFKNEISEFIDGNEDAYELIRMNDAKELVFDVIQEYYQNTGRVLSIEDAAKHTEGHLEEEAKKIFEAKRFKQSAPKKEEPVGNKAAPTLSNTQSSEVPISGERKLSREASLKEAAKLIRWEA